MSENGTSAKKVTLMDAKEDFDKICIEVQTTSDNAGGQPTWGFSLQHKTFSALNYAQDFGITVKESLKRTTCEYEVGYTHEKSNCPVSNTFMPLSALSAMSRSPIGANSDWIHQLNSKNNGPFFYYYYLRLYFGTDNVSRRLWQWIASHQKWIESKQQDTGHIATR